MTPEQKIKALEDRVTTLEKKLEEQSPEEIAKRVEKIISEHLVTRGHFWG